MASSQVNENTLYMQESQTNTWGMGWELKELGRVTNALWNKNVLYLPVTKLVL